MKANSSTQATMSLIHVMKAAEEAEAKVRPMEIDLKSILSFGEWLAAGEDAPKFIKNCEAEAVAEL